MKLRKYRIVRDIYSGYECQVWRLWFPFWVQMNFTNTHSSLEGAINYIENNKRVVWESKLKLKNMARGIKKNRLLAEKIILALDDYGRKVNSYEYGLPIDPDTKDFEDKKPQEMLKIVTDILNL